MKRIQQDIGIIGVGVMGRNLAFNIADHGFSVAVYDRAAAQIESLKTEASGKAIVATTSLREFVQILQRPRIILMLVPAGAPVDAVIEDLLPLLQTGDGLIDAGNSHFRDTDRRTAKLEAMEVLFMGVGISGGEHGARFGPSIMPGGNLKAYERVRAIFEAIAARVQNELCVAYLGSGSAGHFVKMVHNGIEYGIMELIAEAYDLMKRGLRMDNDALHEAFARWNKVELNSFLMEITAGIFLKEDVKTGQRLIDVIMDAAEQKGTGRWTSQDAMDLAVPIPTIDAAVMMREMSALKDERIVAAKHLGIQPRRIQIERNTLIGQIRNALWFSMAVTYAQGMALLRSASEKYDYGIPLSNVARIWRGGCIIRSAMLEDIRKALDRQESLANLMLDPHHSRGLSSREEDLREVLRAGVEVGIPVPAFSASLAYFDAYRSAWLPLSLLQAQRDYFGAHTYERIDQKGTFHTQWREDGDL
jgi:6-phosphogluconate dehydrogenase